MTGCDCPFDPTRRVGKMLRLICMALVVASAAHAQQAARDSDRLLGETELSGLLSGQMMEFFDDSQAFYLPDGAYEYRYGPEEPPFRGTYSVTDESSVCVSFDNGFERCDLIVDDGNRYVMIIENGDRYPIRSLNALE